jgi:hypothetical protein
MIYEITPILNKVAECYIPVLAFLSLLSLVFYSRLSFKKPKEVGIRFLLLVILLLIVYGLLMLDQRFGIWPSFGRLDYSTHTALSLALVMYLAFHHKKYQEVLVGSFVLYVPLMLYQKYNSVADIAVTGIVIGAVCFSVLKITERSLAQA